MKSSFQSKLCRASILFSLAAGSPNPGLTAPGLAEGSDNALVLEDAVKLALLSNPDLRASEARVDAAAGRAYQATRWSNPELDLSAEDWPVSNGGGFSDAKQTVGITQTLPYPGKKSLDSRIGGAGVRVSEEELALRRTEIARDVKASFYRVLAGSRLAEVAAQLVTVAEASATTARKRVEAGAAPYQEQLRGEVQLEQTRTELTAARRELASARQDLARLLGKPDLNDTRLSGSLAEAPQVTLMNTEENQWLERHPSAAAARAVLDRARLESRRAQMDPYPDVRVGVSGGRIGETRESIIQLGFSVPLPVLDRGKGRQQEAHANVVAAEADLEAILHRLQQEHANAQQRYRAAADQVTAYRERILPKAEEALRLVQTGFEQGKFGFTDLVDTQRTTAIARLAYLQRLLELNIAQAELEALIHPQKLEHAHPK